MANGAKSPTTLWNAAVKTDPGLASLDKYITEKEQSDLLVIYYITSDGCTYTNYAAIGYIDDESLADWFCELVNQDLRRIEEEFKAKGEVSYENVELPYQLKNIPFFQNTCETGYLQGELAYEKIANLEPLAVSLCGAVSD